MEQINLFSEPVLDTPPVFWEELESALMLEVKREDSFYTSSCVAISRNVLLTAAHCVEDIDYGHVFFGGQSFRFKEVFIHPAYDPKESLYKHDLALIHLENNLPIKGVGIDFTPILEEQSPLCRVGFGGRDGRNLKNWTGPLLQTHEQGVLINQDHDSVVGDSGGPIYYKKDGKMRLIGIHSTLEGHDKTFSVFLPHYRNWILAFMPLAEVVYSSSIHI